MGRRIVALLGASNLSMGAPAALRYLVEHLRGELELYLARGFGRSYGGENGAIGFTFRGLRSSGVLEAVAASVSRSCGREQARPDVSAEVSAGVAAGTDAGATSEECTVEPGADPRLFALLTDVGNDILYRVPVDDILAWVDEIVAAFRRLDGEVALTALPVASVARLSRLKFRLLRPLFYPFRPMPFEELIQRVHSVQAGLERIAASRGAKLLPAEASWYGPDHFHLSRRHRDAAFRGWLEALLGDALRVGDDAVADDVGGEDAVAVDDVADDSASPRRLTVTELGLRFRGAEAYRWLGRPRGRRPAHPVEIAPGVSLRVL